MVLDMDGLLHASRLLVFSCSFLFFPLTTDSNLYDNDSEGTNSHITPSARPPTAPSPRSALSNINCNENAYRVVYAALVGDFFPIGITNAFGCLCGITYSVVYLRNCWDDKRAGVRRQAWIIFGGAVSIVG